MGLTVNIRMGLTVNIRMWFLGRTTTTQTLLVNNVPNSRKDKDLFTDIRMVFSRNLELSVIGKWLRNSDLRTQFFFNHLRTHVSLLKQGLLFPYSRKKIKTTIKFQGQKGQKPYIWKLWGLDSNTPTTNFIIMWSTCIQYWWLPCFYLGGLRYGYSMSSKLSLT